jgi:outer membrane protein assembly factor BamB
MRFRFLAAVVTTFALLAAVTAGPCQPNLCPNPGAEEGANGQPAGGWYVEGGKGEWGADQVHSGAHSFKIVNATPGPTIGWTSTMIPVPAGGEQLLLTVWAKMDHVTGKNGAFMALYHTDEKGVRIGQSAELTLGGVGDTVATTDWQQYTAVSRLTPQVKGVRVNMRLYGATGSVWFDDVVVQAQKIEPMTAPRPLRRGLRVAQPGGIAIVSAAGADDVAAKLQAALRGQGCDVPIVAPDKLDLMAEKRDLIVLGNLATSPAIEYLYRRSYTIEDLNFPGKDGYVIRPLIDPLGTGANLLVLGASDPAGLAAGADVLIEKIKAEGAVLDVPLTVKSAGFRRIGGGWLEDGAIDYLTSGNVTSAQTYRQKMLANAATPDARIFHEDYALHLFFVRQMMSWDLMEGCGVFSDAERLQITNYLLKIARSDQGYGYAGLRAGLYSRENHGTRAARAFYYAWRYYSKYYSAPMSTELVLWRNKLRDFWAACFASSRTFEDSLSQHALGGAMDNILDIGLQEPDWSREFFASGRARQMAERCMVISNNMGQTVLLGDTGAGDYAGSIFAKLGYVFRDGRYLFMLHKRGSLGYSTDEPLRHFDAGIAPQVPADHIGLKVIPADDLFFRTMLQRKEGVPFERAFDKLSLRSGFDADDEYLMLDGTAGGSHSYDDANTIGEFSAHGRRWLCEIDIFNGPTLSFHNAVTVAREGLGDPDVPQAVELVTGVQGPGWAYTATRLPHYNQTAWTRHLLWRPGQYTFVLDELTAEAPGDYSFVLGWRSLGQPSLQPGRFESAQDERRQTGLVLDGLALVEKVDKHSGKALRVLGDYNALFYRAEAVGDFVELPMQIPAQAEYEVVIRTLSFTGRSIIQTSLDGKPLGAPIDQYVDGSAKFVETSLGRLTLAPGAHRLRFEVVGQNPASKAMTFAVGEVGFYRPGDRQQSQTELNRFRLLFPPTVPATLDRDTETLGKYLPPSRHYEPVLNILEQSQSRKLEAGGTACFQNVFYAMAKTERSVELRQLNDHCALVKSGDEIALIGAAVAGTTLKLGPLQAAGKLFCVSPQRLILHEATVSLSGKPLSADTKPDTKTLSAALAAAWQSAGQGATTQADPYRTVSRLKPAWQAELSDKPLSVVACTGPAGRRLAVGQEGGLVSQFEATGKPAGELQTGGPVYALRACDLDADGSQELLVGSDDTTIRALRPDLSELWRITVPFLADEQPWSWWTLGSAKIRRLYTDDLNGDGRPEILAGVGNMRLHCFDAAGKELWRYRTDHGICTTITSADVFGEGKRRVLAGNGLTSSNGSCWVLDEQGKVLQTYYNGSWCTSLPAIAVGDLDGDGKQTVFCGNNRGDVRAYPGARGRQEMLWIHNMTRPVRSLTIIPRAGGGLVAVGSDSGYLCAFDQAGQKAWGVALSSAISHTVLLRHGEAPLLAAGCKDGKVFVVTPEGKLIALYDSGARLQDLIAADLDGDDHDEIVGASAGPNRLWTAHIP